MRDDIQVDVSEPLNSTADDLLEVDSYLERMGEMPKANAELWKLVLIRLARAKASFVKAYGNAIRLSKEDGCK